MTAESRLWSWLSGARKHYKQDLHMNRVENKVVSGMPDVEGCLKRGGQFWIELKVAALPKRAGKVRVKIRPKQVEWHRRRWKVSGNHGTNYFLVQVGSGASRRLFMFCGSDGALLRDGLTVTQMNMQAIWTGDKKSKPQDVIAAAVGF